MQKLKKQLNWELAQSHAVGTATVGGTAYGVGNRVGKNAGNARYWQERAERLQRELERNGVDINEIPE